MPVGAPPFIDREEIALLELRETMGNLTPEEALELTALRERAELEAAYAKLLAPEYRGVICLHGGMA